MFALWFLLFCQNLAFNLSSDFITVQKVFTRVLVVIVQYSKTKTYTENDLYEDTSRRTIEIP